MNKKWITVFFLVAIALIIALAFFNFIVDPFGYFDASKNDYTNLTPESNTNYCRLTKAKYIKNNPEKYNMFIFGGSNAEVIKTETINKLTGKKSYNSYVHCGTFEDYYEYLKFYINTCPNFEELLLQISNDEMHPLWGDTIQRHIPTFVTRKSKTREILMFTLMPNFEALKVILGMYCWKTQKDNDLIDGSANYEKFNNLSEEEFEEVVKTEILKTTINDSFENRLKTLFTENNRDFRDGDLCVENLRKIKELCDKNNIKLTVTICPTFIGKKSRIEGEQYYSWLLELVSITPIWDFGGFFDANMNPYNFSEADHFNDTTADEMLSIIYGEKENPDFGILLTPLNVEQYIIDRRQKFKELKDEYLKTGTVQLEEKEKSFRFRPTE